MKIESRIVQVNNWDVFKPTVIDTASLLINMIKARINQPIPKKIVLQILNNELEMKLIEDLRRIIAAGKYSNVKPSAMVAGMI